MELSNEFIEDLFLKQIKELTIKTSKQLRSFDAQFSGMLKQGVVFIKAHEESEEDFYSEKYLEEYIEDDEINSEEEGFMIGYLS